MNVDLIVAITALLFGVGLAIYTIRKQGSMPVQQSMSSAQQEDLLRKVATLERDVAALQRMLVEKQNEIDALNKRIRELELGAGHMDTPANHERRRVLLVGISDGAMFQEDLAQLRRVQATTNIRISRLLPVSKASLERTIERHRAAGNPVELLHLGVHAGQQGLLFADGLADGMWLSQNLAGVKIAMLAGCECDQVADLLRVVPAVVSMREEVENRDASLFAGAFWMAVGLGLDANEAFERALQRAPASIGEYVELHL